jgi:hypothetical protein
LPVDAYLDHEREIAREPGGPADDFTTSIGYKLLKEDPESRIVINCMSLLTMPIQHIN